MKKLPLMIVALAMFAALNASAVWSQDPPPPPPPQSQQQPAAQEETVRGKITAVAASSISIEVASPKGSEAQPPKTMEFVTDSSTKTEGKVEAGVTVTITYRVVDGQNVATRVNVEKKK